jgi:hypothetical protein
VTDTNERRTAGRATGLMWLRDAKHGGKDRWIARSEPDLHVHAS